MKKHYFLGFLLFLALPLFAQTKAIRMVPKPFLPLIVDNPPKQKVVEPSSSNLVANTLASTSGSTTSPGSGSPEAGLSNFIKDIPVNLFTGTPTVAVPICGIAEAGIGVNLQLSYNASGIRAQQIASWCGLGWDLGVPMISRQIRDLPDEGQFQIGQGFNKGYYKTAAVYDTDFKTDKEPDFFYLNTGEGSYKFLFDSRGNAHFFPEADIKIKVTTAPKRIFFHFFPQPFILDNFVPLQDSFYFQKLEATLPNGTTYEFGNNYTEESVEIPLSSVNNDNLYPGHGKFSEYISANMFPSAFYCTKITNAQGHKIELKYNKSAYSYCKFSENTIQTDLGEAIGPNNNTGVVVNKVFVRSCELTEIEGAYTKIVINENLKNCGLSIDPLTEQPVYTCTTTNTAEMRQDIDAWAKLPVNQSDAKLLKTITIIDKTDPQQTFRKWSFEYDYFNGFEPNGFGNIALTGTTHLKQLALKKITLPDGNYTNFNYFAGGSNTNISRATTGIDHWGYYNGAINNDGLVSSNGSTYGANREANFTFGQMYSLQSINNSTGLQIGFTFEPNRAQNYNSGNSDVGGMRIKKIETYDAGRNTAVTKEYTYNFD